MSGPSPFDFRDLFVFELANNHQGDVEHGRRIVRELGAIAKRQGIRAAVKLQFRDLDTFIHPAHREKSDNKHIPRFLSTRLRPAELRRLIVEETRAAGLVTMCTPFDEPSVDAHRRPWASRSSRSAAARRTTGPCWRRSPTANKPVIFSTGGLTSKHIDDVVSFFDHRRVRLRHHALRLHLPDPGRAAANLNQIEVLRPALPGHRDRVLDPRGAGQPGRGARRRGQGGAHAGAARGRRAEGPHTLNAYSADPRAGRRVGEGGPPRAAAWPAPGSGPPHPRSSTESLRSLKRGIFARRPLKKGADGGARGRLLRDAAGRGQIASRASGTRASWPPPSIGKDEPLGPRTWWYRRRPRRQVLFTAIHDDQGDAQRGAHPLGTDFEVGVLASLRDRALPEVGATHHRLREPRVLQEAHRPDSPARPIPCTTTSARKRRSRSCTACSTSSSTASRARCIPGDIAARPAGRVARVLDGDGRDLRGDLDDALQRRLVLRGQGDQPDGPRPARKTRVNHWGRYQI